MHVMESPPGATAVIDGREVDYFCGCGYFCLHGHPEIIDAACKAVRQFGMGSATSRSGYGDNPVLLEVERNAAKFFATESALYYVSGYLGNTILLQGLRDSYDVIFYDNESHYSVLDGIALADKPAIAFAHRDANDLTRQVARHLKPTQRPLLISDGVFPISGEIPPIPDYVDVFEQYDGSTICVDDAHATGVIGEMGRGCFEYLGASGTRLFSSGTLSKALGGHGGIIPGSADLIERLKSRSKIPFASSSPPTPAAAASARALEILQETPVLRKKLWDNTLYAKSRFRALGFDVNDTPVPIICLAGTDADLKTLPDRLLDKDIAISRFYSGGDAYSSVPEGGAVRIAIFSSHTKQQIDRLVEEIARIV
ncbi:MAG: pyridoxal phosphate-dependent aminotransferase family protein [Planctomycetes bacterium]|nr:pyridoxal phosphate-dependent aminotransferase family protein [Planctomycetota bacterium]MBL7040763.1 pyridoxal phosphate-dependent aminotransferase family protein [Pirellulaceae bacterium]